MSYSSVTVQCMQSAGMEAERFFFGLPVGVDDMDDFLKAFPTGDGNCDELGDVTKVTSSLASDAIGTRRQSCPFAIMLPQTSWTSDRVSSSVESSNT